MSVFYNASENVTTFDIKFPTEVVKIAKILAGAGHKAYAVGGCVRDSVMGRAPSDWDMTTDARPEEMLDIFSQAGLSTIPTGLKHGTVTVVIDKKPFEITTFRIDGAYSDSRRPDSVTFSSDISEDLRRRDFTVNAMAADPLFHENKEKNSTESYENCEIVDLFGGLEDIDNRIIRCVGNPCERFSEDALRILRAIRFSATLGFEIEKETLNAASFLSHRLGEVSAERKAVEFEKTLLSDNADKGFEHLLDIGATKFIHEKLHKPVVALSSLPKSFPSRLAALIEGEEEVSLSSMKLSNEVSHKASLLADRNFYNSCCRFYGNEMSANARYMISKYRDGAEAAAMLRSDTTLLSVIECERASGGFATEIADLAVNGNLLMAEGIEQRSLGHILSSLLLAVIKEPHLNQTDTLIALAKELFAEGK